MHSQLLLANTHATTDTKVFQRRLYSTRYDWYGMSGSHAHCTRTQTQTHAHANKTCEFHKVQTHLHLRGKSLMKNTNAHA